MTAIRERARSGDLLLGAFIQLGSPVAAELAGRAGLDWLLVDLEHGAATEASLVEHLTAIEGTGAAAIVRVEEGTRLRIGRALDLGAEGVMIPRLDEPDDIRRVATWLRYPPDGVRGVALTTRGAGLGEVTHGAVRGLNERVLGVLQIESGRAVENAQAIAAIDGIDVLFVGPSDLSHSLGIPGRVDEPVFDAAIRAVADACRAEGVAAGVLVKKATDARRYLDLGYTFIGLGSDSGWLVDGARGALAVVRSD
jgi:4-hydroxy-2-oxoheptanedioate aldolase